MALPKRNGISQRTELDSPAEGEGVVFGVRKDAAEKEDSLVLEKRAVGLACSSAQCLCHETALATRLVTVTRERDHVLAAAEFTRHNEMGLVGVDIAPAVHEVDRDFVGVEENEALPEDMYIHNVTCETRSVETRRNTTDKLTILLRPLCSTLPELVGREVEDVAEHGDGLGTRRVSTGLGCGACAGPDVEGGGDKDTNDDGVHVGRE